MLQFFWFAQGKLVYSAIGSMLWKATEAKEVEVCAILLPSVSWLLAQERGEGWSENAFRWNYNHLGELASKALQIVESNRYPDVYAEGVSEARRVLEKLGFVRYFEKWTP